MAEIAAIPWNGFTVASTFSGGGGSSLGYRMAGFRVVYANEFVEAARATYAANMSPYTFLDGRDIRTITAADVLAAINMQPGELDLLDGSPPCASFSTAGKREAGWGKVKSYSDTSQRTDDLFFEYSRILEGVQPKTFVAENVSGLVKGTAKGYFLEILHALKSAGYRVNAKLLNSQWLGVPQGRQRLIFVGVRNNLDLAPVHPKPFPYYYTLRDALAGCSTEGFREGLSPRMTEWWRHTKPGRTLDEGHAIVEPGATSGMTKTRLAWDRVPPTVLARGGGTCDYYHPDRPESFTIAEVRRICSFPDDFQLLGNFKQQWERMGRAVPPVMMSHIAAAVRDGVLRKVSTGIKSSDALQVSTGLENFDARVPAPDQVSTGPADFEACALQPEKVSTGLDVSSVDQVQAGYEP
jgi:DNA (cytosine-5)-methyltransferase 1